RHCQGFRRRRHLGLYSRADAPGIDVCAVHGPHPERLDASFLRLGIGSDRAREHHVHCFCARRRCGSVSQRYDQNPLLFSLVKRVVFFAWGEIYSLFPATNADTYGEKYATTNAGLLYTAKGTAALLVPLAIVLSEGGQWHVVFYLAAAMA